MTHDEAKTLIDQQAKLGDDAVTIRNVFGHLALIERQDGTRERVSLRFLQPAE